MSDKSNKRVVVAMSGGVDSSVSAALMKEQGYDVTGVSMQLYDPVTKTSPSSIKGSCSLDDVSDAERVANKLGIPFQILDLRAEFKKLVIDYFITEYAAGRTPNPCIRCNNLVKFGLLLQKAEEIGAPTLATGHYARVTRNDSGCFELRTGLDPRKDQSYFLFTLTQKQLAKIIFPVGFIEKQRVRELAESFALPVAQKHESQEICFIPDNDYVNFLENNGVNQKVGDIVTTDGIVVGNHTGLHRFTIGQRKGMGIAWKNPLHVLKLDTELNRVIVGEKRELSHPALTANRATWGTNPKKSEFRAICKIRYRHTPTPCTVLLLPDDRFQVNFDTPQSSVTPGQAAVLYDSDRVLGGGWIE
ncbi:MAG: tRNA 2-thiouridine(34) synthase MnmA [Desulfuromonadaceae bacterium]|nr:tRNA 2-thiouridine(34) synthase MnmA [Desulfuromonadaceae bacterium]MDD2853894.1 tRNA 2-thiouridine(34) synthase MnmA [Desulfuromonadaceae bacterium]